MELPTHAPLEDCERVSSAPITLTISPDRLHEFSDPDVSIESVVSQLSSHADSGLSTAEAGRRLGLYGVNELEKKGKMPFLVLFLSQFANLIIVILIIAAIVSIIVGELVEGVAVIVIILITVCLSTFTEYSSGNALDALAQLTDPHTHVYRNGELRKIRTPELVPGDIIELSPGDLVPADVRIIKAYSAKVNEMILTGESADVAKKENVSSSESKSKLTNINMVYSSTSVVEGRIKGIVLLTGMDTRVGSIAALLSSADEGHTHTHAEHQPSSSDQKQMMRELSGRSGIDYDNLEQSDGGYSDSDDEEAHIVKESALIRGGILGAYDSLVKVIASYQPKKTPLQEGIFILQGC